MPLLSPGNLIADELQFLEPNFSDIRFPDRGTDNAGIYVLFRRALVAAMWSGVCFVLAIGAWALESKVWSTLCLVLLILVLLHWFSVVAVLGVSIHYDQKYKPYMRKSLIFWSWWPIQTFVLCVICAIAGAGFGRYLWTYYLKEFHELATLQTYHAVDPGVTAGQSIQDAGLVEFGNMSDVDRGRGGCFVAGGHTYCVAPIVNGGRLLSDVGGMPRTGAYDYFAVGIDCCTCPNQDFRCGEWLNPYARGGVRSVDQTSRPFYRLAVDDWAAAYRKVSAHPLFFEWHEDPIGYWQGLDGYAISLTTFIVAMVFPAMLTVALLLGKHLEAMVITGRASPRDCPAPPDGWEGWWAVFLPELYEQSLEERRQLMGIPVMKAPWYAPPHEARTPELVGDPAKPVVQTIIHQPGVVPNYSAAAPMQLAPNFSVYGSGYGSHGYGAAPTTTIAPRGIAARPDSGYGMIDKHTGPMQPW